MKAGDHQRKPALLVLIFYSCIYCSYQHTELQVCSLCSGTVLDSSAVGRFCSTSAGRIDGRCCMKSDSNSSDPEHITGLDLSNCSLTHVENLQGASTASIIDLSLNSHSNISDSVFEGFIQLNHLILPEDMFCPGGNKSWERVEMKEGSRVCEGQKNMCNQTGQLSIDCPESSLCIPYGPGAFQCICADNHHGYKCLRQGAFPALQVFAPLGASTVVISLLLWITQRRKVKSL